MPTIAALVDDGRVAERNVRRHELRRQAHALLSAQSRPLVRVAVDRQVTEISS